MLDCPVALAKLSVPRDLSHVVSVDGPVGEYVESNCRRSAVIVEKARGSWLAQKGDGMDGARAG